MTDNVPKSIYVNKIESRITFKTKAVCYLELLMFETMNLLGSIKNKISNNEKGEIAPHLDITEIV